MDFSLLSQHPRYESPDQVGLDSMEFSEIGQLLAVSTSKDETRDNEGLHIID
jgi:hypothetical protein